MKREVTMSSNWRILFRFHVREIVSRSVVQVWRSVA